MELSLRGEINEFSSLRGMPEDVLSVELSSLMILHPRALDVHLSFRVIIVSLSEVQDPHSRSTFVMLLLTHLLRLIFIPFNETKGLRFCQETMATEGRTFKQ